MLTFLLILALFGGLSESSSPEATSTTVRKIPNEQVGQIIEHRVLQSLKRRKKKRKMATNEVSQFPTNLILEKLEKTKNILENLEKPDQIIDQRSLENRQGKLR